MALGFVSTATVGEVIKGAGLFRNQANFAMFMLEESFQTLNLVAGTMYTNADYDDCYEVSTYAIQELVGWIKIASNTTTVALIYPMSLAYIAFFRAELDAFIDFRDKCISKMSASASGTGIFSAAVINGLKAQGSDSKNYFVTSSLSISSLDDEGVWDNSDLWASAS